jgi:hypothetical protein
MASQDDSPRLTAPRTVPAYLKPQGACSDREACGIHPGDLGGALVIPGPRPAHLRHQVTWTSAPYLLSDNGETY